jgi:hypothetical protein
MSAKRTLDCRGRTVEIGMRVRVLELHPGVQEGLTEVEWERLQSIVGDVLEVLDIDDYGNAWVEKYWDGGPKEHFSHSIALAASEIEIV